MQEEKERKEDQERYSDDCKTFSFCVLAPCHDEDESRPREEAEEYALGLCPERRECKDAGEYQPPSLTCFVVEGE